MNEKFVKIYKIKLCITKDKKSLPCKKKELLSHSHAGPHQIEGGLIFLSIPCLFAYQILALAA